MEVYSYVAGPFLFSLAIGNPDFRVTASSAGETCPSVPLLAASVGTPGRPNPPGRGSLGARVAVGRAGGFAGQRGRVGRNRDPGGYSRRPQFGDQRGDRGGRRTGRFFRHRNRAGALILEAAPDNGLDPFLSLYDANGRLLIQSQDVAAGDPIAAIDQHVVPGTYFVSIIGSGGSTGKYQFEVRSTEATPPFEGLAVDFGSRLLLRGDFNSDGRLDLATASVYFDEVSVLLGNGDGTFEPERRFQVGFGPTVLLSGDFNGDGRLDLATANASDNVSVLLGNGDGTFQAQRRFRVGFDPQALVSGDFNGDGRLDLATANSGVLPGPSTTCRCCWATATAPSRLSAASPVGFDPQALASGGLQRRRPPRPRHRQCSLGDVSVLLGNGDGTFQTQRRFAVGRRPLALVTGDFNGDGRLDLVTANVDSGDVSVLLGNGDGTFQAQRRFAVGDAPGTLVVADFNGDGRLDLVTANLGSSDVSVLLGNGDGTFQLQRRFAVESGPQALLSGDFNGDGRLDLATATVADDVSVLLGNGDGTFQAQRPFHEGV